MKQIPTAEEFAFNIIENDELVDVDNQGFRDVNQVKLQMKLIEFAKLHVEAALEASASEYYPKDKENFELITERFLNAYPLDNIK